MIQPFEIRFAAVQKAYADQGSVEIGILNDLWGPALTDKTQSGVLVTSLETIYSGEIINKLRQEKKIPLLDVIAIPWVWVDETLVSSSRKRERDSQRSMR